MKIILTAALIAMPALCFGQSQLLLTAGADPTDAPPCYYHTTNGIGSGNTPTPPSFWAVFNQQPGFDPNEIASGTNYNGYGGWTVDTNGDWLGCSLPNPIGRFEVRFSDICQQHYGTYSPPPHDVNYWILGQFTYQYLSVVRTQKVYVANGNIGVVETVSAYCGSDYETDILMLGRADVNPATPLPDCPSIYPPPPLPGSPPRPYPAPNPVPQQINHIGNSHYEIQSTTNLVDWHTETNVVTDGTGHAEWELVISNRISGDVPFLIRANYQR